MRRRGRPTLRDALTPKGHRHALYQERLAGLLSTSLALGAAVAQAPHTQKTKAEGGGARLAGADAGRDPGFDSAAADVSEGPTAASLQTSAGARRVALARLAGTQAEAEQIRASAERAGRRADVWLGLEASEGELAARDLSGYRVIHFATQGLLDAERPQFTGVVLSLVGDRSGADGFLRTGEVFNLRLGSPPVTLSACETGLGRHARRPPHNARARGDERPLLLGALRAGGGLEVGDGGRQPVAGAPDSEPDDSHPRPRQI